jgi:hypothetical protein
LFRECFWILFLFSYSFHKYLFSSAVVVVVVVVVVISSSNFYASEDIMVIKSRRMRLEGRVARMGEMRNVYRILV